MSQTLLLCPPGSAKFGGSICPLLLENSKAQDCGLRQCAVYGLGMLAQHRQHIFQPIAAEAVQCMVTMIQSPDGRWVHQLQSLLCPHEKALPCTHQPSYWRRCIISCRLLHNHCSDVHKHCPAVARMQPAQAGRVLQLHRLCRTITAHTMLCPKQLCRRCLPICSRNLRQV